MVYKNLKKKRDYHREYMKKWRKENPERVIELSRKSDGKRKERNRIRARKYAKDHKKERAEYQKKWRKRNPDYTKLWFKKNREKARKYNRKYQSENPEYVRKRNMKRYARKHNAKGSYTAKEWENLKKKHNYICVGCGRKEPEIKLTPDHIIPLSKDGSDNIGNIQPLCGRCNSSKGAKLL